MIAFWPSAYLSRTSLVVLFSLLISTNAFLLGSYQTTTSSPIQTANGMIYELRSNSYKTWFEANRICNSLRDQDTTSWYMPEFSNEDDWDTARNEFGSLSKYWIGLIFINNKGYWSSGREFTSDDVDRFDWSGTKPFEGSAVTGLKCARVYYSKWKLESCDIGRRVMCQSEVFETNYPFRISNTNQFGFLSLESKNFIESSQLCTNAGATLGIFDDENKNIATSTFLNTLKVSSGTTYLIGLNGASGAKQWSDGTPSTFSAWFSLSDENSSDQCTVFVVSCSNLQCWKSKPCSNSYKAICTTTPGSAVMFLGMYYTFVEVQKNYHDAKSYCNALNGNLVTVSDPLIHAFLAKSAQTSNYSGDWWIGLRDLSGNWEWESSVPFDYVMWKDSSQTSGCVILNKISDYYMDSVSCSESHYFVCGFDQLPVDIDDCASNPCTNGDCTDLVGSYTCLCDEGYTGENCNTNINDCATNPCVNGNCNDLIGDYSCLCDGGYTGRNCDINIDECSTNPCINGICTDLIGSYSCLCDSGYTGQNCDTSDLDIDDCATDPCVNGNCNDLIGDYSCLCDGGYTGRNCDINIDECSTNPCINGICTDLIGSYSCLCNSGYTGQNCDTNVDDCAINPCVNGNCDDLIGDYSCLCDGGYTGRNCDINIDDCASNPCINGACTDLVANYSCSCNNGFSGVNCDINIDDCASNPCINGNCNDLIDSYSCLCDSGFTGGNCETNINECASNPCVNGNCNDLIGSYSCSCDSGYTGGNCDIDIDDCASNPCINGICTDLIANYNCSCDNGFSGVNCDINIDDCASNPCVNGTCTDLIANYSCSCDNGFSGVNCDINVDECASNPCINGNCNDLIGSYSCSCDSGYTGGNCDIDIDDCASNPCINGACTDLIANYSCSCDNGFSGVNCDINIDDCASNPCINGACTDLVASYSCSCDNGFSGVNCDINIDECASSPCVNGICTDLIGNYSCFCYKGYTGGNCDMKTHVTVDSININSDSSTNVTVNVSVQVASLDVKLCVFVDFGDMDGNVLLLRHINESFCVSLLSATVTFYDVQEWWSESTELTLEHTFSSSGSYDIRGFYYNGNITIEVAPPSVFSAQFTGCIMTYSFGGDSDNTTVMKSEMYTAMAYLSAVCDSGQLSIDELNVTFEWNLLDCSSKQVVQTLPQFQGVLATFPSNALAYGCNLISSVLSVFSSADGHAEKYTASQVVHVIPSPLVVQIKGGILKTALNSQNYIADAQGASYDPDAPDDESAISYVFEYQLQSHEQIYTLGNTALTQRQPVKLVGSQNGMLEITIPSPQVGENITVTVYASASYGRSANFSQQITFVAVSPPSIEIRCLRNCLHQMVNPKLSSVFGIYFLEETNGQHRYQWSLRLLPDSESISLTELGSVTTTRYLELPANLLTSTKYLLHCSVRNSRTNGVADAQTIISTAAPPYNGSCTVSPLTGRSLRTKFIFSCSDWLPATESFLYSYYISTSNRLELLTESRFKQSTPLLLPSGPSSNNYEIDVVAFICAHQTFCAQHVIKVVVDPPYLSDKDKSLRTVQLAGSTFDVNYVGQASKALLPNNDEKGNVTQVSGVLLETAKKIVSSHKLQTTFEVTVLSEVLNAALNSQEEAPVNATSSGSHVLKNLGSSLQNFLSQTDNSLSANTVMNIAGTLTASMGSLLNASHQNTTAEIAELMQPQFEQYKPQADEANDLSPREVYYKESEAAKTQKILNAKAQSTNKEVVSNVISGASDVTDTMTNMKLSVANKAVAVQDKGVDLSVITMGSRNDTLPVSGLGSTILFNATDTEQDVKLASFETNPFNFDESSRLVNSGIVRLSSDKQTNSDSNGVVIKLANRNAEDKKFDTFAATWNRLSLSRFEIRNRHASAMLYVVPAAQKDENVAVTVWIRQHHKPVVKKYSDNPSIKSDISDYVYHLPADHAAYGIDPYKIFISPAELNGVGTYFVGLEVKPSNGTTVGRTKRSSENTTSDLSIAIFTPSCQVYDETTGTWGGSTCSATADSNIDETSCNCPSLASNLVVGAEFTTAPNFIDFSSVFSKVDLINNGAVFFTITGFIVLFVLILIWGRREDKRDVEKWATKVMLDNSAHDSYYYKISVITGMGRNAGTTSNVYFVLAGEVAKTNVRQLVDISKKHWFESGSVVHFLMSVPQCLGDLEYIRIWHDNSGLGRSGGNWFLNEVVIQDLHTSETYFFNCDDWLAVELGDGKIDRVLPVAGDDNLSSYKHVFATTARDRFTDGHVWFSIFVNRSKSNFTRCQRLACAMMALFLSMISNAMFYRDATEEEEDEDSDNSSLVKIGPFAFDPQSLWISTITVCIVLPPSLMLIQIFRKTESKQYKTAVASPNSQQLGEVKPKSKMLPHWFVYVGWALFCSGVLASGFFTILYSFQWGKEKSERWLSTMILSFVQDSAVVQPIKVVIIAALIALICRKSLNMAKSWKETNDDDVILTPPCSALGTRTILPEEIPNEVSSNAASPVSVSNKKLKKIRKQRVLEKKAMAYFLDFALYVVYLVLIFYIAYNGHQDYHFYKKTSQVRNLLETESFDMVTSARGLFDYLENTFVPALYSTRKYNGDRKGWRDRVFVADDVNYRVGPARLRQLRIKPGVCEISNELLRDFERLCVDDYLLFKTDKENYFPSWEKQNSSFRSFTVEDDYWKYSYSSSTNAIPLMGKITMYGAGGYLADLGINNDTSSNTLSYLKEHLWIDRSTRALMVEFTLYNVNSNVFTTVILLAEFLSSGGCLTTSYIRPFRLYQLESSTNLFIACILAVLFVLFYTCRTVMCFIKKKRKFFKRFWNYFAIVRIVLFISFFLISLHSYILQDETLKKFQQDTYLFTNFQSLSELSGLLRQMVGVILFVETIQVLEFFRYQKQIRKFSIMFRNGLMLILEFSGIFFVNLICYSFAAWILFSVSVGDYRTFIKTLQTLFGGILGSPTYHKMNQVSPLLAKVFYFVFSTHMTSLLLNFLIGVIDLLLHTAKNQHSKKTDGKHAYFQIAFGLILNHIRRLFKMKEKEISYFKKQDKSGNSGKNKDSLNHESGKNQGGAKRRRMNRKRNHRQKGTVNNTTSEPLEQKHLVLLHRLKVLEEIIDSIDVSVIVEEEEEENKPELKSYKSPIDILDEVENIFNELPDDLMNL